MVRSAYTQISLAAALVVALAGFSTHRPAAAQAGSIFDDPFVEERGRQGLDYVYNIQFAEANRAFSEIEQRYPGHPVGSFLKALPTWWEIMLDLNDERHHKAFLRSMEETIRRSDRMLRKDKNNVDALFFKGAALGFASRLRSNRGDWIRAAHNGKRALGYVMDVARIDPNNDDFIFANGIYDYYADVIPKRYKAARPLMAFFPNGNRTRGILELQRTAERGTFLQTEAVYWLAQIFYVFEGHRENSVQYVTWLRQKYPDNPFFHLFEGRVYATWQDWYTAEAIFTEVLRRSGRPGYNAASTEQALYYLARADFVFGRHADGLEKLARLDHSSARLKKDTYFRVWGRLRQGMAYDQMGQREKAVARYREVLKMKDFGKSRDRAKGYLKAPYARGVRPAAPAVTVSSPGATLRKVPD